MCPMTTSPFVVVFCCGLPGVGVGDLASELFVLDVLVVVSGDAVTVVVCTLTESSPPRVSDCLCAGAWFTSTPRIGLGMPQLVG